MDFTRGILVDDLRLTGLATVGWVWLVGKQTSVTNLTWLTWSIDGNKDFFQSRLSFCDFTLIKLTQISDDSSFITFYNIFNWIQNIRYYWLDLCFIFVGCCFNTFLSVFIENGLSLRNIYKNEQSWLWIARLHGYISSSAQQNIQPSWRAGWGQRDQRRSVKDNE